MRMRGETADSDLTARCLPFFLWEPLKQKEVNSLEIFFYWRAVDHLNILCYRLDLALKITFFEINCNTIQTALTQNLKVLKMAKCLFVWFQSQVYVNSFLDGNFHISQDMWWSRIGFIISIGANQNRNPRPRRPKQLLHHPLSLLSSRGLTVNSSSSLDVSL